MKSSLKLKLMTGAAAGAAFVCSLAFCSFVLFGSGLLAERHGAAEGGVCMQGDDIGDQPVVVVGSIAGNAGSAANSSSDAHKPVILIDPGHGGFDGGAEGADGTMEKNINLQIALKLRDIMADYPVEVILTREDDRALTDSGPNGAQETKNKKRQDLENRRRLMEESGAVLVVSIHLNSFPADVSVYGAQVFYPREQIKRTDGRTDEQDAKILAENIQKALETNISDGRERVAMSKGDIIIFKEPVCPVILVECGFLSNKVECDKLKTAEYQEALASAIWKGLNENLCLEKNKKTEIVDSANKGK